MPDFKRTHKVCTVGELRESIKGVPDEAVVWYTAPEYDNDPLYADIPTDDLYDNGIFLEVEDATDELRNEDGTSSGCGWSIHIIPNEEGHLNSEGAF